MTTMTSNILLQRTNFISTQPTQTLIAVQSNQWSTGICSCFDDLQVCCFAYWCFPCFACSTTADFGECLCLPVLDMMWTCLQTIGVPSCIPPVSMSMRAAMRTRYGIQGEMVGDCVYSTFCNVCSWCQMARELKRRSKQLTVVNAQSTVLPGQTIMMASQPTVVTSQPVITMANQGILL